MTFYSIYLVVLLTQALVIWMSSQGNSPALCTLGWHLVLSQAGYSRWVSRITGQIICKRASWTEYERKNFQHNMLPVTFGIDANQKRQSLLSGNSNWTAPPVFWCAKSSNPLHTLSQYMSTKFCCGLTQCGDSCLVIALFGICFHFRQKPRKASMWKHMPSGRGQI